MFVVIHIYQRKDCVYYKLFSFWRNCSKEDEHIILINTYVYYVNIKIYDFIY